ncbi:MAG: site-specific integrase, partial [Armatimonadetes bacterium]|nr:site-specific integrase [Armatimonadota bacterium]
PSGRVPQKLTWEAAIELFIQCWRADHPGIRPGTLDHYREQLVSRVAAFASEQEINTVQEFDRYALRGFVTWLDALVTCAGKPLSPRGKQMALDTAKRFLLWLYQEHILSEDITAQVGSYRLDSDPEPRATPAADLQKALSYLDQRTPLCIRNTAMVYLMAFCGLRVSEMTGLNANDLSLEEGRVRIRAQTTKVRRSRFVDLPLTIRDGEEAVQPEVMRVLQEWLRIRGVMSPGIGEDDALLVNLGQGAGQRMTSDAVRTVLRRTAISAGIDPGLFTPHRLRHYFGLSSAMAGVPTTALMRAMGHRSPIMTARYSEFADSQRRWAFAKADITKGMSLSGSTTT